MIADRSACLSSINHITCCFTKAETLTFSIEYDTSFDSISDDNIKNSMARSGKIEQKYLKIVGEREAVMGWRMIAPVIELLRLSQMNVRF